MSQPPRRTVIANDLTVRGQIRNSAEIDIYGHVIGTVEAGRLRIHQGGRVDGTVKASDAEVDGALQGDAAIRNLIAIGATGTVNGNIKYGKLALAPGGELSADVRNVPPEVTGDFHIVVRRGRSVRVTTSDVTAIDPDDTAATLHFTVSNPVNGYVALSAAPRAATETFSQADLEAGKVLFVHDGSDGPKAGFDVVVIDKAGATSGAPQTVTAAVVAG